MAEEARYFKRKKIIHQFKRAAATDTGSAKTFPEVGVEMNSAMQHLLDQGVIVDAGGEKFYFHNRY